MEMIYIIIIALVLLYLLSSKEGYETTLYMPVNIGYEGGVPSYSSISNTGKIDWLNVSDLDYGKLVSKLQGKSESVRIRNLV